MQLRLTCNNQRNLCWLADGSSDQDEATLMVRLARIQQIATAWREADPQELPHTGAAVYMAENLPGVHWLPFTSQVICVLHCNASLRCGCQIILSACWTSLWIIVYNALFSEQQCLLSKGGPPRIFFMWW